jgi:hypothetical protein
LTEAGAARFREARPTNLAAIREQFVSRLDDDDLEHLARAWEKIEDAPAEPDGSGC